MNEAQNDPIKKADLIRDMVMSISKINNNISRESYIKECSKIMNVSEQVLFNTLKQIDVKNIDELNKKLKQSQNADGIRKVDDNPEDIKVVFEVDIKFELERKIIEMLLLYGSLEADFEDYILKANEEGVMIEEKEIKSSKVFERIYLSLHEDEVELANPMFKEIYNDLIAYYNQNENFNIEHYLMQLSPEHSEMVTDILMLEEKELLHNWETKQIYVKKKTENVGQYVSETIISLREYLINKLIMDMMNNFTKEEESDLEELKSTINDYNKLKVSLTNKIGRIRSTYL
jgi:DNA primase